MSSTDPGGTAVRVLPDTSVLFPVRLINLVMRTHVAGIIEVVWTDELLEELVTILQSKKGLTPAAAQRIVAKIRARAPRGRIDPDRYRELVGRMTGPDPKDHIHAAAAQQGADVLLTDNPRDFPDADVAPCQVRTPAALFGALADDFASEFALILLETSQELRRPPKTPDELLDDLGSVGLVHFVDRVREQLR